MAATVDILGKFVYVTASSKGICGYAPADMVGEFMLTFVHPDDTTKVGELVRAVRAGQTHKNSGRTQSNREQFGERHARLGLGPVKSGDMVELVRFQMRKKDGSFVWMEVKHTRSTQDEGEAPVHVMIFREVTEQVEAEINERVLMIITVRSPRADDLRRVLAATKAAQSLERIGDYARNVGKRTRAIMESEPGQLPWDQLIEIGTMVASMIDDVMAAYQEGDLETAQAIRNSDLHVDKLHTNIFRHVIEQMDEGKISALNGAHLLFIAKNIERIGDFTTSLAEQIMFVETGVMIDDKRPKADKTSGLSDEG